jgi:heme/copper-type cytochrome/quinol oxidase subunit 3
MEGIPYTVEEREDTGLYNAKLGIWLFLASEVMLFGALFSSYVLLRTGALKWPSGSSILNVPIGTFNTLVLITSSVTMVMSWIALKENNLAKFKKMLGGTLLLAVTFLVVKAFEYGAKFHHHPPLLPSSSTFMAIYFTLTGLHALHIVGGIVVNGYLWGPGSRMFQTDPERFTNRIEVAGLYWHFVDLVWIFLFPILYLL